MIANSEVDFYVDTMIIEMLLSNNDLSKTAQAATVAESLVSKVKHYFDNHIDPDDKGGSLLNIIAPGALSFAFSSMGLGKIGILIGFMLKVFNVDIAGALSTIYNDIKSYVTQDKKLSSSQVQSMVDSALQQHSGPVSEEDAQEALKNSVTSMDETLKDAKLLKLALMIYETETIRLVKNAKPFDWNTFSSMKSKKVSILSRVLGAIFKIGLASAGFMVAGDVVNKFLGRPNAFDDTIQKGKPVPGFEKPVEPAGPISTQTKFKAKPGADVTNNVSSNWIENVSNTESGIANMVIGFAKEAYEGLDGLESVIRSSSAFNKIVNDIAWYNHASAGAGVVFIPKNFTSKKQLVDHFIDEVASKAS